MKQMSNKKKLGLGALAILALAAVVASFFHYKPEWCKEQIDRFKSFFQRSKKKSVTTED